MAVTWGNEVLFTGQTAIDNVTEEFLDAVDMSGALQAHVQLQIDNESGSVTDAVEIRVYLRIDDTNWDDEAFMSFSYLPETINVERLSFIVPSVYEFRIGALSAGPTDTYAVDGSYRLRTA